MCGIAGIACLSRAHPRPPAREALERMIAALHHRGPDERGLYRDPSCGLVHARLSIIDLAGGTQPLSTPDETLWIVFNGEIFNYIELRDELSALGHRFRSQSDTEVILHAWEQWQEQALERLNGQWALAIWDRLRRRLVLSRDRLGVRPLYYAERGGQVTFASTVAALFAGDPSLPRQLDPRGIDQTFTFWSVVPPQSVFRGISELEPGHVRVYERGTSRDRAYWHPHFPSAPGDGYPGSLTDATHEVREHLERATRLRVVRSDVAVGSYLSGGLDSSLIASLALAATSGPLHTFSLRFDDREYDEGTYQAIMAKRLGSHHHELHVTRADVAEVFPEVVAHAERPILRAAPAPLFLLSKLVRDVGIKVVLTGEGADEMFAGYDLFREGVVRRFWAKQPHSRLRPLLLERLYPYLGRSPVGARPLAEQFFGRDLEAAGEAGFAHQTRWRTTAALKRLWSPAFREAVSTYDAEHELLASVPVALATWSPLAQDQYLEMRSLLAGYLLSSQGDRMLMAHSVEGRFPFLDPDVVALACALPDSYKLRVLDEKHVLKRVAKELIPPEIWRRPKQPYRVPDGVAFASSPRPEWIDHALSPRAIREAGVFSERAVALLWRKCQARAESGQLSNTDNMALLGVLSTQLLYQRLIAEGGAGTGGVARALTLTVDRSPV